MKNYTTHIKKLPNFWDVFYEDAFGKEWQIGHFKTEKEAEAAVKGFDAGWQGNMADFRERI